MIAEIRLAGSSGIFESLIQPLSERDRRDFEHLADVPELQHIEAALAGLVLADE